MSALRYPLVTGAAANRVLKALPTDNHRQNDTAEQAAEESTDGDMVTLITTVQ
jgi:hypothetical protein